MKVPAGRVASAASGPLVTAPLRAPRRFNLVGARWRDGKISLRARRAGGRWTRWLPMDAGEPVWTGPRDFVQLRGSRSLAGMRLHFVDAHAPAARSAAARARQVQLPQGGQLSIVPRAAWGGARCKPRKTAGYGRVDVAFVHHTLSINGYSRAQARSVVLGVCLFHRNVNRWNDIGYDFLVDRYGDVFEGRAGGIEAPVVGAQAGGFNLFSTGVAAIGDFRFRRLPAAGFNALARLLAWKLSLNGVPAEGKVDVVSQGGPWTPFRKGTPVTLNRISGHRDADSTECPGSALFSQLPALRTAVTQLEGPVSRLDLATPQANLVFPQPLTLTGRLTPAPGIPLPPFASVEIQDALARGGRTLATIPLSADGSFSGTLPLAHNDVVQAVYPGGAGLPKISAPLFLTVAPALTLQASAATVTRGGTVVFSGSVSPPTKRVVITQEEQKGARFKLLRKIRLKPAGGAFQVTVGLARTGTYRFTALTPAARSTAPGSSAPLLLSVTG
jgi:N-acetylmuramoyl-L-alanine amidase-like protein